MSDEIVLEDAEPGARRRPRVLPDVVRTLATDILSGRIEPGAALPREPDLSAEYGVSRTVIREALKTLAAKGLVSIRSRVGTIVNDSDEWNIIDPQVLDWYGPDALDQRMQMAILETRMAIEPLIAELAAERATLLEIANLETAWRGMADAGADVAAFIRADIEFHQILYRTSHNPVFRQIGNMIDAALRSTLKATAIHSLDHRAEAVRVHGDLVEALRLRDPAAALGATHAMLRLARRDLPGSAGQATLPQE